MEYTLASYKTDVISGERMNVVPIFSKYTKCVTPCPNLENK